MSIRIRESSLLFKGIQDNLLNLPTPRAITVNWTYGSSLGICLGIQLLTGVFLALHYVSRITRAFDAVCHIGVNVNYGWLIRVIHANGARFFFIIVYSHIARGLYYRRYQFPLLWTRGVIILFLLIAIAFLGYVLPWGQISFWGATVITNLIRAIPYWGERLVYWIWGGFAVGGRTLTRFFAFHFLFPFILTALVFSHLILLHEKGSSNPLGVSFSLDKIPFASYFLIKDLVSWLIIIGSLIRLALLDPWLLGDRENFIPANSLITPVHIKPEWYFLFAYAILRSIPNKLGGVISLVLAIAILLILPITQNKVRARRIHPINKILFWRFIRICIILTWIGGMPVEDPYIQVGQITRVLYFRYYLLLFLI